MNIIKNYLTSQEIKLIGEMASNVDNYMDAEWLKMLVVAEKCTDIEIRKEDETTVYSEEQYNELTENGDIKLLYDNIINIDVLNRYVEDIRKNIVFDVLFNEFKKSFEGIDTNKLISDFSNAVTELKEVDVNGV